MIDRNEMIHRIIQSVNAAQKIAICGHVMPDGDCLGSELALGLALRSMGKDIVFLSPDPVPEIYSFLPGADEVIVDAASISNEYFDRFVSVDCSVPDRLGEIKTIMERQAEQVIIIDHHAGSDRFGDLYLNDPEVAAAGEIILEIIKLLPVSMDLDMATCIYVAIVTDTGSFRYDNTRPETHRAVADLLSHGVDAARINKLLYEEKPLVSLKLLGEVLPTLGISECGRIAWMSIERGTINRLGARDEHADGIINYPRMIKGVELALFYRELEQGGYKVSLRSKYNIDVNRLAALFGGGGHARAAGCIVNGNLQDIQMQLHKAALAALGEMEK